VFFDALNISYRYEAEGFKLKSGYFLPDFLLPDQDIWVEIKPRSSSQFQEEVDRLALLANELYEATGKEVLCVFGEPYPGEYLVAMVPDLCESDKTVLQPIYVFALGRRDERELWLYCEDVGAHCLNPLSDDERWPLPDHPKLVAAYKKARGARFEHGEHGTSG